MREEDIPDIGYAFLGEYETGEQILVDTSDSEFRRRYTELVNKNRDDLMANLKRLNVDFIRSVRR